MVYELWNVIHRNDRNAFYAIKFFVYIGYFISEIRTRVMRHATDHDTDLSKHVCSIVKLKSQLSLEIKMCNRKSYFATPYAQAVSMLGK